MFADRATDHERSIWLWACRCGERIDETISFHRIFRREETAAEREARIMRQIHTYLQEVT
jgi:hypothetical protein